MPEGEPDNQSKQFTPVQPETSGKGNPMNLCGQTDKNGKHRKKYIYAGNDTVRVLPAYIAGCAE